MEQNSDWLSQQRGQSIGQKVSMCKPEVQICGYKTTESRCVCSSRHRIKIFCVGRVVLEQVLAENAANLFQDEGRVAVLRPSWTRHFNQR